MIRETNRKADSSFPTYALLTTDQSPAIPYLGMGGAAGIIRNMVTGVTLTWYGSDDGTNWSALYDRTGSAVTTTGLGANSGNNAFPIPDECFGLPFIQARLDAGTATLRVYASS